MEIDLIELFKNRVQSIMLDTERLLHVDIMDSISTSCNQIIHGLNNGNRIFICGNGGSAADAQHFAAELVGRFKSNDRPPLPCIALTVDTSILTAIANDFGYEDVFSRQLRALAAPDDILIVISTSGNSMNILNAIRTGNDLGMSTIGLLGRNGGSAIGEVDISIIAPGEETDTIQQGHLIIEHFICSIIDHEFTKVKNQ